MQIFILKDLVIILIQVLTSAIHVCLVYRFYSEITGLDPALNGSLLVR